MTHYPEHLSLPAPGHADHQLYNGTHTNHSLLSQEEGEEEKKTFWTQLEIRGPIKNLSPELWKLTHLTALFLNDNNLQVHVHVQCRRVGGGEGRGGEGGGRESLGRK